jgi:hypothetical protein
VRILNIINSAKIAKESLTVGNQVYHINCARKEHGDEKVITELAHLIRENKNVTVAESIRAASSVLINIDDFSSGRIIGKKIRNNLNYVEFINHEIASTHGDKCYE